MPDNLTLEDVEKQLRTMAASIIHVMALHVDEPDSEGWYIDTSGMPEDLKRYWLEKKAQALKVQ